MSSLQIGRLVLGPAAQWYEPIGDPVANLGGAVVPAQRTAPQVQATVVTWAADGQTDTVAARLVLRRQLRALLNNTPLKLQGFLYVQYSDDPEQNGWYAPDQGTLQDLSGTSGLATGLWQISQQNWSLIGHRRTHREGRQIWMKDLRTGLYQRDFLGWIYSTDFSGLPLLELTVLPSGATSIQSSFSVTTVTTSVLPTGRDGGACLIAQGIGDLSVLSYERPEASLNLSDVIVYDRRGNLGPFGTTSSTYSQTVVATTGVLSYWRLNETSGTSAADSVGTNTGTYTAGFTLNQSALINADATAHSVSLNGSTGYVTMGEPSSLNLTGAFSVECWFKTPSIGTQQNLFGNWDGGAGSGYGLWLNSGVVGLRINGTTPVASGALSSNTVYHAVGTYDGTNARLYVNGSLVAGPTAASAPTTNTNPFLVGQEHSGVFYDGQIEEVAVYNQAMSAANVTNHYTVGTNGPTSSGYDSAAGLISPTSAYGWEEVYGPDYPWSWTSGIIAADTPTIENGLVRIRYDASAGDPGFRVDVWTGSAYVEQGKLTVFRVGDVSGYCNTWLSASLVEWTPERAVICVVLANSADSYSRERVYATVQRGELGVTFECYPSVKSGQVQADARLVWTTDGPDSNDFLMFEPSVAQPPAVQTDDIWATTNSSWTSAAGTFSSTTANFLSVLRCQGGASTVGPYQVNLSVVQQATTFAGVSDSSGYGSAENAVQVSGAGGMGYLQLRVEFVATQADQVQSGTLTSWSSSLAADYRVFQYSGATPVFSDVGEYTGAALTLASASWAVAFQTQDRSRSGAVYQGCRDRGQAALSDSRQLGLVAARN